MPILNYTTAVPVERTITEIQMMLGKAGAESVTLRYKGMEAHALSFELGDNHYLLPCRVEAVHAILDGDRSIKPKYRTRAHALRVGWRILRDWVQAQLAIIEAGMVEGQEVFMPYQLSGVEGKTLYQVYREKRPERLLEASR